MGGENDPVGSSVWVALFPGTRVFRWDAREKKIVRSVDCSQYRPKFEGNFCKAMRKHSPAAQLFSFSQTSTRVTLTLSKHGKHFLPGGGGHSL